MRMTSHGFRAFVTQLFCHNHITFLDDSRELIIISSGLGLADVISDSVSDSPDIRHLISGESRPISVIITGEILLKYKTSNVLSRKLVCTP